MTTKRPPVVDSPVDFASLAATNSRVARTLVESASADAAVNRDLTAANAALDRKLREAEARIEFDERRAEAEARKKERKREETARQRADRRMLRQQRSEARRAWVRGRVDYVRNNAVAVYCAGIYCLAVGGAVYGQIDAAVALGQPIVVGIAMAGAIEGTGLAMALTAQQQRLEGERALAARAMTWLATATAVAINYFGHADDPARAIGLSVLSALGIVVYEIRSGARHRPLLRAKKMLPPPPERWGISQWLAYYHDTLEAWRIDVRERVSPRGERLLRAAAAARRERVAQHERDRIRRLAWKAAKKAARRGQAGPVLARLTQLAASEDLPPLLAIPSRSHDAAADRGQEAVFPPPSARHRGTRSQRPGNGAAERRERQRYLNKDGRPVAAPVGPNDSSPLRDSQSESSTDERVAWVRQQVERAGRPQTEKDWAVLTEEVRQRFGVSGRTARRYVGAVKLALATREKAA